MDSVQNLVNPVNPDVGLRVPIMTEQVMFVTLREVIEGTLFHNENVRLSDALNAESRQHSRYITLKDATIYSISTGREILKTGFLLVSHSHVIYMTPKNSVQMSAAVHIQPVHDAIAPHELHRAAAQMESDDSPAWHRIATPPAESSAAFAASDEYEPEREDDRWNEDAGSMPRRAVVMGTDSHLVSRQAMLHALAAIRGQTMEPPRRES